MEWFKEIFPQKFPKSFPGGYFYHCPQHIRRCAIHPMLSGVERKGTAPHTVCKFLGSHGIFPHSAVFQFLKDHICFPGGFPFRYMASKRSWIAGHAKCTPDEQVHPFLPLQPFGCETRADIGRPDPEDQFSPSQIIS